MDVVAVFAFVVTLVLIANRAPATARGNGFFADPLPALTMLGAASLVVGAGLLALVSLLREPLHGRRGTWAIRLGVFNALLMPVLGLVTEFATVVGSPLPTGWGEPLVPLWVATALGAVALGAVADERRHRGLLMLPALLGAAVLTFWLGEVLSPH